MTREEVKQIVLRQCAREKKIVLRDIIVVALLVTIVLALLWIYGHPSLILYNQQAIAGIESHDTETQPHSLEKIAGMHYILYIALIGTPVVLMVYSITLFNSLSRKRAQIQNAISSVDALFIQRSDLLPNLIASVKQYMVFERETLEKITELRQPAATHAGNPYLRPEEGSSILRQIMIQAENYPELKAGSQFTKLHYSFQECEEKIAAGRRFLSASITDYNTSTVVFPWNMAAKVFGFKPYQWQYASEAQRQVDAQGLFRKF